MQVAISIALLTLAVMPLSQAFGRFGYVEIPSVPGIRFSIRGFSATYRSAEKFEFINPLTDLKTTKATDVERTISTSGLAFTPSKINFNLLASGMTFQCPSGLKLHCNATGSPYLTWKEGSVEDGVPTPKSKWIAVSFRTAQPAYIFGFPNGPVTMKVTGRPGDWTLDFIGLAGMVRIGLLKGTRPIEATTAAGLGELAFEAERDAYLYHQAPPKIIETNIEADSASVTATWHFDRPGAIVPNPLILAPRGGYNCKVFTPTVSIESSTEEGPLVVCKGGELKARFPIHRVPTGRGLTVSSRIEESAATVAPEDVPSVVDLALEVLRSNRDMDAVKTATDTFNAFLERAHYEPEPVTGLQLPFGSTGVGVDIAAAQALLAESLTCTTKASSDENALLTSLIWKRDWLTWKVVAQSPLESRRATAIASIAAALCPEPERRLDAAMLEAGLAADRGLMIWKKLHENEPMQKCVEPLLGIRQGLFDLAGPNESGRDFVASVLSPVRIYGEASFWARRFADRYILSWSDPNHRLVQFNLAAQTSIRLEAGQNLQEFVNNQFLGMNSIKCKAIGPGTCRASMWSTPELVIPSVGATPRYSEPVR